MFSNRNNFYDFPRQTPKHAPLESCSGKALRKSYDHTGGSHTGKHTRRRSDGTEKRENTVKNTRKCEMFTVVCVFLQYSAGGCYGSRGGKYHAQAQHTAAENEERNVTMNEQLRQLLADAFTKSHCLGDIAIDDTLNGNLPEEKTKCDFCAFYTGEDCGSPFPPAEAIERKFSPCREGISFAYSGIPGDELNKLFLEGREIPFLTLNLCPPDKHPEPTVMAQTDTDDQGNAALPF